MKQPVYWTMKNGQKINVDEMSLSHLQNTLKMIVRNNQKREFKLNGDMANEYNGSYEDDIYDFESDLNS